MSGPPFQTEALSSSPKDEGVPVLGYLIMFIGVLGVAYGITALWFGMRETMEVGGFCAEGGAYVIRQPCPDKAELLMFTGIPAGIIGIFVALVGCAMSGKGAGALLLLGWPALFVSLGWNFIEYAIDPPEGMGSTVGWWICGVLFMLMGLPALAAIPMLVKGIQPDRRNVILGIFLVAVVAGVLLGIRVAQ